MKAALVDVRTGTLVTKRYRIETPRPAAPHAMGQVFKQLVDHFDHTSAPIGCAFPGVIRRNAVVGTAANLDDSWVGVNAAKLFSAEAPVTMINDADAAGMAEIRHGAGKGIDGVIFMLTIGTGFGTAIFNDGVLLPNVELGHIEIDGVDAERLATSRAKKKQKLSRKAWAKRLEQYLNRLEDLVWPDLFIIGGGISKSFDEFAPLITTRAKMVPAHLRNNAGIVGAAIAASQHT